MSRRSMMSVACALALALPVFAAPVPKANANENAVAKARAALKKTLTAKGDSKSFADTIELFKDLTKAEITLDAGAIQMMGFDVNTPILKFDVKDATLKDALKAAFGPVNLKAGVTASGIVISTEEGLISRQMRERVSVEGDGKTLGDVLRTLAETTGANIVFDPRAKKIADEKVMLALDDVPLESAVRLLAEVSGASVVRMSNVLFVTTEARADKLRPDADRPVGPTAPNPFFPGIEGPGGIGGPGGGGAVPIPPIQVVPPPAAGNVLPAVEIAPPKEVKK